jgi:hypothetical protein
VRHGGLRLPLAEAYAADGSSSSRLGSTGAIERTEAEPETYAVEHHPVRAEDAGKRSVELLLDAKGGLLEDAAGLLE